MEWWRLQFPYVTNAMILEGTTANNWRFAVYSSYQRAEQSIRFTSRGDAPLRANEETLSEYRRLYRAAFAPETLRHLDHCQKQFSRWCLKNGFSDQPPISPLQISKYVESLGGVVSTQTIKNRVWAIGELHKSHFLPSPCKHRLVVITVRAMQRRYGAAVKQAPALCRAEIVDMCNRLGNSPIDVRDKALILTASDTWCRASEIVAMRVKDVEQQPDNSGTVFLRNSKCDPYGRGEHAYLSTHGFRAIMHMIESAEKQPEDFLFSSFRGRSPGGQLAPTTVSRILKKVSGRPEVSAHSTRIGGVHDALRLGCDLVQIMTSGRWASPEMPAIYGRKLMASKSAAADVCRAYEDLFRNSD